MPWLPGEMQRRHLILAWKCTNGRGSAAMEDAHDVHSLEKGRYFLCRVGGIIQPGFLCIHRRRIESASSRELPVWLFGQPRRAPDDYTTDVIDGSK